MQVTSCFCISFSTRCSCWLLLLLGLHQLQCSCLLLVAGVVAVGCSCLVVVSGSNVSFCYDVLEAVVEVLVVASWQLFFLWLLLFPSLLLLLAAS